MGLERLTQAEFDRHIEEGTLRLAFIGMSNVGKSYRAKVLQEECNFFWYRVDAEILRSLGLQSEDEVAAWLGLPDSSDYSAREKKYLEAGARYTKVDFLDTRGKNLVFDTTGSVIYLPPSTTDWLKEHTLLVHIDAGEDSIRTMFTLLLENPKPLVWNGSYAPRNGETQQQTLVRSYPALLSARLQKYRGIAHINIPAARLRDMTGKETLRIIRSYL